MNLRIQVGSLFSVVVHRAGSLVFFPRIFMDFSDFGWIFDGLSNHIHDAPIWVHWKYVHHFRSACVCLDKRSKMCAAFSRTCCNIPSRGFTKLASTTCCRSQDVKAIKAMMKAMVHTSTWELSLRHVKLWHVSYS